MSWTVLPAFQKTTGSPLASASIQKNKTGQLKLTVFLSAFLADRLGGGDTVEVAIGAGDHAGCLRLTPGETHSLTNGIKGSRRLSLPHFEGLPMEPWPGTPCKIERDAPGEVIVRLPLGAWVRQLALPAPVPAPVRAAVPAAIPAAPVAAAKKPAPGPAPKDDDRVDLVMAMRVYDRRISRVIDGLYLLDGDRVETEAVLELLNSYRRREQLRPLTKDQVK